MSEFSAAALDAFRRYEKLLDECTCTERDWRRANMRNGSLVLPARNALR